MRTKSREKGQKKFRSRRRTPGLQLKGIRPRRESGNDQSDVRTETIKAGKNRQTTVTYTPSISVSYA